MINFREVTAVLSAHNAANYYHKDSIPEKKLLNARIYMEVPADEIVFGLCDYTVFGSAKEGVVFTNRGIYARYLSEKDSITYEELGKCTVTLNSNSEAMVNKIKVCYGKNLSSMGKLIKKLSKALRPIDLSLAKKSFNDENYKKAAEQLAEEEKHINSTSAEDIIEYRMLCINTYIGLQDIKKAESLLNQFKAEYGTNSTVLSFIKSAEAAITQLSYTHNHNLFALQEAVSKSKELIKCEEFDAALQLLQNQKIQDCFDDTTLANYYQTKIEAEIGALKIQSAKDTVKAAHKLGYISSSQKDLYTAKIKNAQKALRQRLLDLQKVRLEEAVDTCKTMEQEGNLQNALETIYNLDILDFPSAVKKEYFDFRIELELKNADIDAAKASIEEMRKINLISEPEKADYFKKIENQKSYIQENLLNAHRNALKKAIETAKMFEDHGILESASDTINAAIADAPEELTEERVEAFKHLVELLLAQYEYDQIYQLKTFYKKIASDSMLGFSLDDLTEKHKTEHCDEYHAHLHQKAVYYIQFANYEEARKLIQTAKAVKDSFEIRCTEIELELLEFNYKESRILIDALIRDKKQFSDCNAEESIEYLLSEYASITNTVSCTLKVCAVNNTEEVFTDNNYDGFIDANGLNLPSIAARFANYDIISKLSDLEQDCSYTSSNDGFSFPFFAAMNLDFYAFSKFISNHYDESSNNNFIINEKLDIVYEATKRINQICKEKSIKKPTTKELVLEELYNIIVMLFVALLNDNCFKKVCTCLQRKKAEQIKAVERLENELPALLLQTDEACNEKCTQLTKAANSIKKLITQVPANRAEKANNAVCNLEKSVTATVDFVRQNAQIAKDELQQQLKNSRDYIYTIEQKIALWKAVNKKEIEELFKIPAEAIKVGDYDESSGKITLFLAHRMAEVDINPIIAQALLHQPDKVSVENTVCFDFTEAFEFTVKHQYTYSVDNTVCKAEFIDCAKLQNTNIEKQIADLLLPETDYRLKING